MMNGSLSHKLADGTRRLTEERQRVDGAVNDATEAERRQLTWEVARQRVFGPSMGGKRTAAEWRQWEVAFGDYAAATREVGREPILVEWCERLAGADDIRRRAAMMLLASVRASHKRGEIAALLKESFELGYLVDLGFALTEIMQSVFLGFTVADADAETARRQTTVAPADTPMAAREERIASEDENLPPLSATAALVYEILCALKPHEALTAPKILDAISKIDRMKLVEESTLRGRTLKELVPYGIKNKRRVGYYIEADRRPKPSEK